MTAQHAAEFEPAVASPGSLIITFAGLHLRRIGGWIAVADLLALLEGAGQPAASTRQALVRLKSGISCAPTGEPAGPVTG